MKRIIVSDHPEDWSFLSDYVDCISISDYISQSIAEAKAPTRVFNLSKKYGYQKEGYYVSLLAEARGHKVFPTVLTIQDAHSNLMSKTAGEYLDKDIQHALKRLKSEHFELSIYFGKNISKQYDPLCKKFHGLLPFPLFMVSFKKNKQQQWGIQHIKPISYRDIPDHHHDFLQQAAIEYFRKRCYPAHKKKTYQFDLAILQNPHEANPPSNPGAIQRFVEAAESIGFCVELIEKSDYKSISEYDALFIRETTAVNHHTYQFSRKAEFEQLVVVDDPGAILKCTNKVYLQKLIEKNNIDSPVTTIIGQENWRELCERQPLPCVVKQPDSAFSHGVVKVETTAQLKSVVKEYLKHSALIIVQSFLPSTFDWRIGIFNHIPIYACRYYMAKDHWQIYNWQSTAEKEGEFDTVPVDTVPENVIKTALKASKLIGDGFYGVDLKEIDGRVYVIEINDNPNVDQGIEDQVAGQNLYLTIMNEIKRRVVQQHGY